ncbi:MAG: hypothetical protein KGL39_00515 [Patescibacteria group bacterium]|nr:hypothetical protein [Patescibacteria group bacterium]
MSESSNCPVTDGWIKVYVEYLMDVIHNPQLTTPPLWTPGHLLSALVELQQRRLRGGYAVKQQEKLMGSAFTYKFSGPVFNKGDKVYWTDEFGNCAGPGTVEEQTLVVQMQQSLVCIVDDLNPNGPPPEQESLLEKYAVALGLERGTDKWQEFFDLADTSRGQLPRDLLSDDEILKKLPILLRMLDLDRFIEVVRRDGVESIPEKLGGVPVFRGTQFSVSQFFTELAGSSVVGEIAAVFEVDEMMLRGFLHSLAERVQRMVKKDQNDSSVSATEMVLTKLVREIGIEPR